MTTAVVRSRVYRARAIAVAGKRRFSLPRPRRRLQRRAARVGLLAWLKAVLALIVLFAAWDMSARQDESLWREWSTRSNVVLSSQHGTLTP